VSGKSTVRILLVVLLLPLQSCAPVRSVVHRLTTGRWQRVAESVTIQRDEWGIPHIHGPTDASVVFGLAYAQAEDDFAQVEEDFARSIGRFASLRGEAGLESDLVRAAFEVERLSREELAREEPAVRELWTAFAEGLNYAGSG
jgi:acyl-homoserine-lactone acylase